MFPFWSHCNMTGIRVKLTRSDRVFYQLIFTAVIQMNEQLFSLFVLCLSCSHSPKVKLRKTLSPASFLGAIFGFESSGNTIRLCGNIGETYCYSPESWRTPLKRPTQIARSSNQSATTTATNRSLPSEKDDPLHRKSKLVEHGPIPALFSNLSGSFPILSHLTYLIRLYLPSLQTTSFKSPPMRRPSRPRLQTRPLRAVSWVVAVSSPDPTLPHDHLRSILLPPMTIRISCYFWHKVAPYIRGPLVAAWATWTSDFERQEHSPEMGNEKRISGSGGTNARIPRFSFIAIYFKTRSLMNEPNEWMDRRRKTERIGPSQLEWMKI